MTLALPCILSDLVAAHNAHDPDALVACFAPDAVVRDEGRTHVGHAAIRAWFSQVIQSSRPTLEVTDLTSADGEPVLEGLVSGTFPGSPIRLRFFTGLDDGRIVALKIAAASSH